MNPHEDFGVADIGLVDVSELQNLGRAVSILDDRLHRPFLISRLGEQVSLRFAVR
jgi:hypothetical protein